MQNQRSTQEIIDFAVRLLRLEILAFDAITTHHAKCTILDQCPGVDASNLAAITSKATHHRMFFIDADGRYDLDEAYTPTN
jgi:hypothetical protein